MSKFILLHLYRTNGTVAINVDTIQIILKDYLNNKEITTSSGLSGRAKAVAQNKENAMATCVYFQEGNKVTRVFVNESVERVYNMLSNTGVQQAVKEPVES